MTLYHLFLQANRLNIVFSYLVTYNNVILHTERRLSYGNKSKF